MANPEHVQILKENNWNEWRLEHPDIMPDLSGAHLSRADLEEVDFERTDLTKANLREARLPGAQLIGASLSGAHLLDANLRQANLNGANLNGANLTGATLIDALLVLADLSGADLSGAHLRWADLSSAQLRKANLRWSNLNGANLHGADLSKAILWETVFGATNLRDAKGLEECNFSGPCTLDTRTIQQSGMLPLPFLRGCGLPDSLIEYLPSLLNEAIQFFSCFISYSTKDKDFADRLYADLQARGVRCWFAPEDLKIGDRFQERIEESIRLVDKVMIILSEASVQSRWVEREVNAARDREDRENRTVLFPIRVDDAVMNAPQPWAADIRRSRHIGDFSEWKAHDHYQRAFDRLLSDLKDRPQDKATAQS